MKIGFLPIFGSMFGAIFWRRNGILCFTGRRFTGRSAQSTRSSCRSGLGDILLNSALILLISGVVYGLFSRRIRRGLA
jgi:hypothetical protein